MFQGFLVFCLVVAQFTALRAPQIGEECKDVLSSRNWKRSGKLRWLQIKCWWLNRSLFLSTEDAEHYFYQQEMYRHCLGWQLELGIESSVLYFGKPYSDSKIIFRFEPFCTVRNISKLQTYCRETMDSIKEKYTVIFVYPMTRQPECEFIREVNIQTSGDQKIFYRTVVRCPVMIEVPGSETYLSDLYISCADNPLLGGSFIYILAHEKDKNSLNILTLLVNWQPIMYDL